MIDVRVAADDIETRLRLVIPTEVMQGFRAVIDEEIETPPNDVRVKAYWVLYAGSGRLNDDRMVPGVYVSTMDFTVTVAAGTDDRALFGVGQVRMALAGVQLTSGLVSEIEQDLGSLREDRSVTPPRQYLPLQFRLEP